MCSYSFKNEITSKLLTHKSHVYIYLNECKQITDITLLLLRSNTWRHLTVRKQMISLVKKLVTLVEGDPKTPFSIATTPRCRGGCYFIPWIVSLYPWSLPYLTVWIKKSSGSFKNIIYKMCLEIIYLIHIYKKDLALNNL